MTDTPITQADRDAANHAFDIAFQGNTETIDADIAERFARHRIAAERETVAKIVAWLNSLDSHLSVNYASLAIEAGAYRNDADA